MRPCGCAPRFRARGPPLFFSRVLLSSSRDGSGTQRDFSRARAAICSILRCSAGGRAMDGRARRRSCPSGTLPDLGSGCVVCVCVREGWVGAARCVLRAARKEGASSMIGKRLSLLTRSPRCALSCQKKIPHTLPRSPHTHKNTRGRTPRSLSLFSLREAHICERGEAEHNII